MTKPYKCRVEYLESDSTAYIDTGVSGANDNLKIEMGFSYSKFTAYGYFFSNYESETANVTRFCLNGTDTSWGLAYINTKSQDGAIYTSNFTKDSFHTFVLTKTSVSIDGNTTTNNNPPVGTANTKNIILFNRGAGTYYEKRDVGMRCYYFRIYDNDVLVRDLIPVLDNSGKPAMYDQVSGQLFYNQGSGEFTYGRQIIPVEYLESTGTQYIDTGFEMSNENMTFNGNMMWTQSQGNANFFFGYRSVNSAEYHGDMRAFFIYGASPAGRLAIRYGVNTDNSTSVAVSLNTKFNIAFDGTNLKVNDTTYATLTQAYTPANYKSMWLFNCNTTGYYSADVNHFIGRIYNWQIKQDGVLVRDFIPCIDENLTPFMFDNVNCTVYLNAGTGQFKVGPNVEKFWGGKKLRRKLALALANLKKKRPYYCEVEYIENTGTGNYRNWINTGIVPDTTTRWEVRLSFNNTTTGKLMGCGYVNPNRFNLGLESNKFRFAFNAWFDANSNITTPDTNAHTWIMDAPSKTFTIDEYSTTTTLTFGKSTFPICLFGRGNSASGNTETTNTVIGKIYYTKIWQNGVLVRDMIPVLDWDMTPCMFDRVTEQFFYNAGTGDFIAGREIHPVEYLESTGVEYVDTGIKFDGANTKIELKTYEDSLTRRHSICGDDGNFFYYFRGTGNWAVGYNNTAANIDSYMSVGDNVFVMDKNNVYVNDVLAKTYTASSSISSYNALLFNRKTSLVDNGAVTIYYCKIWNNNVLVRDYIPAIDENGVGFMFDRVSHTCFLNQGTGAFKYPAREVEYLQSDGARAILAGVTVDDTCGYDVKWMALNADDRIIMGTKGSGESRWVLSGSNNPNVNLSWNTSYGSNGLGLNKIQTAQMNYLNDRKRILNDTPLEDITTTLSANASTYSVGIFGGYWGSATIGLYSTCRIYYAKISKGTELIRDFVPMVKDGSPCLYDKVGGEYYFGIGTGSFTRGKIVEPEYE